MLNKLLNDLRASVRDIVLAGLAAGAGVIIAAEVLPKSLEEWRVLGAAAAYAALRAAIAYIAAKLA